ncbi:endonuclease domain-containing 1 protein-like [Oculina patagonica]
MMTTQTGGDTGLSDDATKKPEHESQLVRLRRSAVFSTIQPCYTPFFVDGKPPSGFRLDHTNIRYICQRVPGNSLLNFYSTMFDLNYGIPIYSAYVVRKEQVGHIGAVQRTGVDLWRQETGITFQGSGDKYSGQKTYAKGHLLPAQTYSFTDNHMLSTFTYTNAVPQVKGFNSGVWAQDERNIRNYAKNKCSKEGGDLYLITGISEARIQMDTNSGKLVANVEALKSFRGKGGIKIPNSMWTAACCVNPATKVVKGAFAVIGNNLKDKKRVLRSLVTVSELEAFLHVGVNGFGGISIKLFPGNPGCSAKKIHVNTFAGVYKLRSLCQREGYIGSVHRQNGQNYFRLNT